MLCASLAALYRRHFAGDSEEVQLEWLTYLRRSEASLQEALGGCVRRSLQEVLRALQGSGGGEISPLFVLNVVLDVTNGR